MRWWYQQKVRRVLIDWLTQSELSSLNPSEVSQNSCTYLFWIIHPTSKYLVGRCVTQKRLELTLYSSCTLTRSSASSSESCNLLIFLADRLRLAKINMRPPTSKEAVAEAPTTVRIKRLRLRPCGNTEARSTWKKK